MTVRRWLLRLVAIAALAALAFVGVTIVALEAGEVAVLETRRADGSVRRTHVWFAALRAKYGWRDAWVGIGVDSSRSLAVRLTPVGS